MVFFTDHYNAISICRLPSKTKIGKDSWYLNNSLLCKPEFSSATNTFLLKHTHKKATTLQQMTGGNTPNLLLKRLLRFSSTTQENIAISRQNLLFLLKAQKKKKKNTLQQVTGENTPSFALKRLLRPFLKFPPLKKILQFQEKICLF